MTPDEYVVKRLLLPDLKLVRTQKISTKTFHYFCIKTTEWEICRKCPTKCYSVHDHRSVSIRDAKFRNKNIRLIVKKRRFRCPKCKSVFTEAVSGIKVGYRTTENYRSEILFNSKQYSNLKSVASNSRCSEALVYRICYERLELELRKSKNTPWGKSIGIDEHGFRRNKKHSRREFVTVFVDNKRKCLRELACSRNSVDLREAIEHIPGRENVSHAVMDMSDGYRKFILETFPNASIVADKFHVLRLIHPSIRKYRKEVTGDNRKNPIRHLLLKNRKSLSSIQKKAVNRFCRENPNVNEVYRYKERIYGFYRIKGYTQAGRILTKITDDMALSKLPEMRTLRRTLLKWRKEILRYFSTGLTNARTEGFNRKCKLIQRTAYGFKSFRNYRLRALYDCS